MQAAEGASFLELATRPFERLETSAYRGAIQSFATFHVMNAIFGDGDAWCKIGMLKLVNAEAVLP